MKGEAENIRITISFGFLAAYIALFWGSSLVVGDKIEIALKFFACISGFCFFLYLAFTGFKFSFDKQRTAKSFHWFGINKKEIEKFRQWAFDAGVCSIFEATLFPFFNWSFDATNNFKSILGITISLYLLSAFIFTVRSFFKQRFIRAYLLFFLVLGSILIVNISNKDAGNYLSNIETNKEESSTEVKAAELINIDSVYGKFIIFLAGKNWFSQNELQK